MKSFSLFMPLTLSLFFSLAFFSGCTETQTPTMTPPEVLVPQTNTDTETETEYVRSGFWYIYPPSPACDILIFEEGDDFPYDPSDSLPPPAPEHLHRAAFADLSELRQRFETSLFVDNFRLLRLLTESQNYLSFLSEASPIHAPYPTLDDFWKTQPPPTEEILPLFEGLRENPSEKLIAHVHSQALSWQCYIFDDVFNMDTARDCGPAYPFPVIPYATDRAHVRNAVDFAGRYHDTFEEIPESGEWANVWVDPLHERYQRYAEDTNRIYQKKIRGFFNTYGADTGMLWLAIQEPAITGFILGNFTHENMLKAWLKDGYEEVEAKPPGVFRVNNDDDIIEQL